MKRNKILLMLILISCSITSFTSCNQYDWSPPIGSLNLLVRYNDFDTINLGKPGIVTGDTIAHRSVLSSDSLEVTLYRQDKNQTIPIQPMYFELGTRAWNESRAPQWDFSKMGTMLRFAVSDVGLRYPDTEYDTYYLFTLKSKKLFGTERPHTIKIDIHKKKEQVFNVYRCEVDSQVVSVDSVSRYTQNNGSGVADFIFTLHQH